MCHSSKRSRHVEGEASSRGATSRGAREENCERASRSGEDQRAVGRFGLESEGLRPTAKAQAPATTNPVAKTAEDKTAKSKPTGSERQKLLDEMDELRQELENRKAGAGAGTKRKAEDTKDAAPEETATKSRKTDDDSTPTPVANEDAAEDAAVEDDDQDDDDDEAEEGELEEETGDDFVEHLLVDEPGADAADTTGDAAPTERTPGGSQKTSRRGGRRPQNNRQRNRNAGRGRGRGKKN